MSDARIRDGGTLGPIMMDLQGLSLSGLEREQLTHPAVGGVILFTRNYQSPDQLQQLTRAIRDVRPELLIAADTEGGRVQRFREGFLNLPAAACFGQRYQQDPAAALRAARAGGWLLAAELRAVDVDLAFAPVLDIDTGLSGVIGDRAFADSAVAVSELSRAFSSGMQAAGMAVTGKHYPGHGFVKPDSHVELPEDLRCQADLDACDLLPYAQDLDSVMVAHVRYAQIDDLPASISPFWINTKLRQQRGYRGAVFSDDLSMGGLAAYGDARERVQAALLAGCDMLPLCNQPQDVAYVLAQNDGIQISAAASARLMALHKPRRWVGLDALRADPDYPNNLNVLNDKLQVKVEVLCKI